MNTEIRRGLRIGILDIETSSLRADYGGYIVCAAIQNYSSKRMWTIRIDDPLNPNQYSDRWVVRNLTKKIAADFDLLITWNGTLFDLRFIDSRCYKNRLPLLSPVYHRDIIYHARSKLVIRSRRLNVVHDYLFGNSCKTVITEKVWSGMLERKKWAIDYMVAHCKIDVTETADIYNRFLPFLSPSLRKRG